YLKRGVAALPGYALPYRAPTFNEFVVSVRGGDAARLVEACAAQGVLAGVDLGRVAASRRGELLVAVTERHTRADLDRLLAALGSFAG
ncbi:MAG TPA: glycine dehydrogenase, partial [Minicystis sp.]|nr:glycine dehydrogenase [Minicystis sp.]